MSARWGLVLVMLAGCSLAPQTTLPFPRHDAPYGQVGDGAALDGALTFRDGCLWLDGADGETFLPIWPSDTKPGVINSLPVVLMADDLLVVETGESGNFGGSQVNRARAEELAGTIPDRCATESFWVVTTVDRAP